jgi:hypothetical protein
VATGRQGPRGSGPQRGRLKRGPRGRRVRADVEQGARPRGPGAQIVIVVEEGGLGGQVLMGRHRSLEEEREHREQQHSESRDAGTHLCDSENRSYAIDLQLIRARQRRGAGGATVKRKLASTMCPSTDSTR